MRLTVEHLDALEIPASLTWLREHTAAMLPRIDLPELTPREPGDHPHPLERHPPHAATQRRNAGRGHHPRRNRFIR